MAAKKVPSDTHTGVDRVDEAAAATWPESVRVLG